MRPAADFTRPTPRPTRNRRPTPDQPPSGPTAHFYPPHTRTIPGYWECGSNDLWSLGRRFRSVGPGPARVHRPGAGGHHAVAVAGVHRRRGADGGPSRLVVLPTVGAAAGAAGLSPLTTRWCGPDVLPEGRSTCCRPATPPPVWSWRTSGLRRSRTRFRRLPHCSQRSRPGWAAWRVW